MTPALCACRATVVQDSEEKAALQQRLAQDKEEFCGATERLEHEMDMERQRASAREIARQDVARSLTALLRLLGEAREEVSFVLTNQGATLKSLVEGTLLDGHSCKMRGMLLDYLSSHIFIFPCLVNSHVAYQPWTRPLLSSIERAVHKRNSTTDNMQKLKLVRQQQVEELRAQVSRLEPQTPD